MANPYADYRFFKVVRALITAQIRFFLTSQTTPELQKFFGMTSIAMFDRLGHT